MENSKIAFHLAGCPHTAACSNAAMLQSENGRGDGSGHQAVCSIVTSMHRGSNLCTVSSSHKSGAAGKAVWYIYIAFLSVGGAHTRTATCQAASMMQSEDGSDDGSGQLHACSTLIACIVGQASAPSEAMVRAVLQGK